MTSLVTRSTKGAALTHNEMDANLKRDTQTKAAAYTVVEADNRSVIEVTATATITLPDAASIAGLADTGDFEVTLVNTAANTLTIARVTGADTIKGTASDYIVSTIGAVTLKVNQAGDGYNLVAETPVLNTTIVDIGVWDMNQSVGGNANLSVAHGVADFTKIRSISAMIVEDGALSYWDFMATNTSEAATAAQTIRIDGANVRLQSPSQGHFDNANYNNAVINRGWITIQYLE